MTQNSNSSMFLMEKGMIFFANVRPFRLPFCPMSFFLFIVLEQMKVNTIGLE